jgi:hypothetical protein
MEGRSLLGSLPKLDVDTDGAVPWLHAQLTVNTHPLAGPRRRRQQEAVTRPLIHPFSGKVAMNIRDRFKALIPLVAIGFSAASSGTQAAGFDCKYAKTKVEKLICADPALSKLDGEMSRLFKEIENETAGKDGETGKPVDHAGDEQRQWREAVRDVCTDTACLESAYTARLAAMRKNWADALDPGDR